MRCRDGFTLAVVVWLAGAGIACGGGEQEEGATGEAAGTGEAPAGEPSPAGTGGGEPVPALQDSTHRLATVSGLDGPEAVRFDPDQDVWFVSNFSGGGGDRDANGFIARIAADGTVDSLRFITGNEAAPLHAPRGMAIEGDTLWVADVEGVHGFDRRSGAPLAFTDFTAFEPGFLNDVAVGPDGALYVTDTGTSRVLRMDGPDVTVVLDSLPDPPNGITWDPAGGRFLLAPWGGGRTFRAWAPGGELEVAGESPGGDFDGIEIVEGRIWAASQQDSALHVLPPGGRGRPAIRVPGRPADIGVDTGRGRVAVPYIALDRVDIWRLPPP